MKRNSSVISPLLTNVPTSVYYYSFHKRLVFLISLFLFVVNLQAQKPPHPSFRHYTTDNGLVSSEVYHILQDKQGFIWISSDNGVSKFDGYNFRNYGLKDGLLENVIFVMQLDSTGRIWMQAMSGRLYYMQGDSIIPYWNNDVISSLKGRAISKGFIVEGDGETIHISTFKYGVVKIFRNGETKTYSHPDIGYRHIFEKSGIAITGYYEADNPDSIISFRKGLDSAKMSDPINYNGDHDKWTIKNLEYSKSIGAVASLLQISEGKYLYQLFEDLWYIENGNVNWQIHYPLQMLYARIMKNGKLFIGLQNNKGLQVFDDVESLRKGNSVTWLHNESISNFMEDSEGGRWFATNENGIFYMADDALRVFDRDAGFPDSKVTALSFKNKDELFVGFGNGTIILFNRNNFQTKQLPLIPGNEYIRDLYFDARTNKLWAGKRGLYVLENGIWKIIEKQLPGAIVTMSNRIIPSLDHSQIWGCNHYGFMRVSADKSQPNRIHRGNDQRTLVVREDYKGNILVGRPDGLFVWVNDSLRSLEMVHPAFNLRIEDIALLHDSTIVVATKGGGIVLWKGDYLEQITMTEGLTADMLECVYVDNNDVIWAGTLNGLNRISGIAGNKSINQITIFHGLPSNEINRISSMGNHIWVATNKGLVDFSNSYEPHNSPKPILRRILVNNKVMELENAINLKAHENNLVIYFSTMNFRMNGKIPYRYRMDDGEWMHTQNRSVHFPSLQPGGKSFEVQSKNEDGRWSESSFLNFIIHPPWWNTLWAKIMVVLILLSGIWGYYKFHTRQLIRAHKIQMQIKELESSALQAQMNPHFIFNCLNSIQSFILQNDTASAIRYLGNFATLTRSTLNASVQGKIPISEEIKLLKNYLALESLRFNHRFSFTVETSKGLEIEELEIPPLLVQPYVENAIKHGISGKQSEGIVNVFFEQKFDMLCVTISDNGIGIHNDGKSMSNESTHKSLGMGITSKRLNLLYDKGNEDMVKRFNLYDTEGQITGTQVEIKINIKSYNHQA